MKILKRSVSNTIRLTIDTKQYIIFKKMIDKWISYLKII